MPSRRSGTAYSWRSARSEIRSASPNRTSVSVTSASSFTVSLSMSTSMRPSTGPASRPAVVKNIAPDTFSACRRREPVAKAISSAAAVARAQVIAAPRSRRDVLRRPAHADRRARVVERGMRVSLERLPVGGGQRAAQRPRPETEAPDRVQLGGDQDELRGDRQPRQQADDRGEEAVGVGRPPDRALHVAAAEGLEDQQPDRRHGDARHQLAHGAAWPSSAGGTRSAGSARRRRASPRSTPPSRARARAARSPPRRRGPSSR